MYRFFVSWGATWRNYVWQRARPGSTKVRPTRPTNPKLTEKQFSFSYASSRCFFNLSIFWDFTCGLPRHCVGILSTLNIVSIFCLIWALGGSNIGQKTRWKLTIMPSGQTHFGRFFGQLSGENTFSENAVPIKYTLFCYINIYIHIHTLFAISRDMPTSIAVHRNSHREAQACTFSRRWHAHLCDGVAAGSCFHRG